MKEEKSNKSFYPFALNTGKLFQTMFLGCALLLIGCEKDHTTGGVTGFVKTIDKYAQFCDDKSGVKVSIANCSGYTNSDGKYEIDNVPIGIHTMAYSKEGYSSDICTLTITPGDIPVNNPDLVFLSEKPNVKITSMDISVGDEKLIIKGTLSESYTIALFRVFIHNTSDVSYKKYDLSGSDLFWWIYFDNSYGSLTNLTYYGKFEKEIFIPEISNYVLTNPAYVAIYIANPFYINESGFVSAWPVTQIK